MKSWKPCAIIECTSNFLGAFSVFPNPRVLLFLCKSLLTMAELERGRGKDWRLPLFHPNFQHCVWDLMGNKKNICNPLKLNTCVRYSWSIYSQRFYERVRPARAFFVFHKMLCIFSHNFFDSILSLYQLSLFLLWKPFNISDRTTLSFNVKVFLLKSSRVYPMLLKMFVFKIPSRIVNQWLCLVISCVYISRGYINHSWHYQRPQTILNS